MPPSHSRSYWVPCVIVHWSLPKTEANKQTKFAFKKPNIVIIHTNHNRNANDKKKQKKKNKKNTHIHKRRAYKINRQYSLIQETHHRKNYKSRARMHVNLNILHIQQAAVLVSCWSADIVVSMCIMSVSHLKSTVVHTCGISKPCLYVCSVRLYTIHSIEPMPLQFASGFIQ